MNSQNPYHQLVQSHQTWVETQLHSDPNIFKELAKGQSPPFLFIGCVDSRIPPNIMTQTGPGQILVHRNVANLVRPDDTSLMATLEFGIFNLNIKHIIICGHTCCGGVTAAFEGITEGTIPKWVSPIRGLYLANQKDIDTVFHLKEDKINRLSELNIKNSMQIIRDLPQLQNAFQSENPPIVHGWMFDIASGQITEQPIS
ncbi:MAG: carbonic anhydrase [Candidatus Margulisbacteria bacterium]|nr:carbonic anhydrase [Candidatus Margulisiibacteriota bacterium]